MAAINTKTVIHPIHSTYFNTNGSSLGPAYLSNPATRKKRAPLPINEATTNGSNAKDNRPAVMVNNLYGMGENPATNTTQIPHSPNQARMVSNLGQWY